MKIQSNLLFIILLLIVHSTEAWIRIRNKGGYVARFSVDYHTFSPMSKKFLSDVYLPVRLFEQTLSSGNYPVGRTRVLDVPHNAMTARIRAERFIFYPFFGWYWKEIFRQEINPQDKRCFDIWGTTAQPRWTSVNC